MQDEAIDSERLCGGFRDIYKCGRLLSRANRKYEALCKERWQASQRVSGSNAQFPPDYCVDPSSSRPCTTRSRTPREVKKNGRWWRMYGGHALQDAAAIEMKAPSAVIAVLKIVTTAGSAEGAAVTMNLPTTTHRPTAPTAAMTAVKRAKGLSVGELCRLTEK